MARKKNTWATYEDYLQSELWKNIRKQVHSRDGDHCQVCGKSEEEIAKSAVAWNCHHWRYPVDWAGDNSSNVVKVCKSCHDEIHAEEFTCEANTYAEYLIEWLSLRGLPRIDDPLEDVVCLFAELIASKRLSVCESRLIVSDGEYEPDADYGISIEGCSVNRPLGRLIIARLENKKCIK